MPVSHKMSVNVVMATPRFCSNFDLFKLRRERKLKVLFYWSPPFLKTAPETTRTAFVVIEQQAGFMKIESLRK